MVVVPAGSFTMGSPENEEGHQFDEGPQHAVTISRQFAVGRFALTFGPSTPGPGRINTLHTWADQLLFGRSARPTAWLGI
jgi:hypothetical protein